jgi:hypothetical protein
MRKSAVKASEEGEERRRKGEGLEGNGDGCECKARELMLD